MSSTRGISVDRDLYVGTANDLRVSSQNRLPPVQSGLAGPRRVSKTGVPVQTKGAYESEPGAPYKSDPAAEWQPDFSRYDNELRRGDDAESLL